MNREGQTVSNYLQPVHNNRQPVNEQELDQYFGLDIARHESQQPLSELLVKHGARQQVVQGDLPYDYFQAMYHALQAYPVQSIFDVGAGYGRLLLYGAVLHPTIKFHGVEIVPYRAQAGRAAAQRLGLSNMAIYTGNALQFSPWPTTTVVTIMNSFYHAHWPPIVARLKAQAAQTDYLLVSVAAGNLIMEQQPWLTEVFPAGPPASKLGLRYFQANAPHQ